MKLVAYGADRREVVLAIRGPGELIGEMAALAGQRRTATVIAVDDVEVGYLRGRRAQELPRSTSRRRARPDQDAGTAPVRGRPRSRRPRDPGQRGLVAKRLVELATEHGKRVEEGTLIEFSLTQDELASWTGATRETVSRALRLMRRVGWIQTDNRSITVLDLGALRERCGNVAARR